MDIPFPAVSAPRLRVRALACQRGGRLLFTGVDFTLAPGQIVWLRGANGQGKTTLLRTLAGLSAPEAGEITWGDPAPHRRFLYVAHANALKEDLSGVESLRFLLALAGEPAARGDIDAALGRFGLAGRRHAPVRTLSQGQRRRVALARLAVASTPETWLLDEPFDGLDAAGVATLNGVLVGHAERGGSIVLTSHLPLEIRAPAPVVVQLEAPVAA
ncbi:MAG: cytochrome c biogenesis heme-transporting ATPase CcmA [Caldimonas sp.]